MPRHAHVCPECGEEMHIPMNSGILDTMGGGRQFAETHWSDSLAISPSQVKAHQKLFPDVRVRPDGVVGFDSVAQQDQYLNKTGFVKQTQKIRGIKSH